MKINKTYKIMKNLIYIAAIILALNITACKSDIDRSSEDIARNLIRKVKTTKQKPYNNIPKASVEKKTLPFEAYTYEIIDRSIIKLYGKNLYKVKALLIGDVAIELQAKYEGTEAEGKITEKLEEGAIMALRSNHEYVALPEVFSSRKLYQSLPKVYDCSFEYKNAIAPERIEKVGGKEVRALLFSCKCDSYKISNAPVTVFLGGRAVTNDQLTETKNNISGIVYQTEELEKNAPISIDFGEGLRSLATTRLKL